MSMTNGFETSLLTLIFNNTAAANVGDASGLQPSATAGSFFVSAHTSDPGEAASAQTTNETSYTNYGTRPSAARSGAGWTVSGNTASNAAIISFPQCGATGATLTHFGLGSAATSTGVLQLIGALTASLAVSNGITPSFAIGALQVTGD